MSRKSERLFAAITDIDDKTIEEAAEKAKKPFQWKRWVALAAVIALIVGAVRIVPNFGGGAGGAGSDGASSFMSYAGPVMPVTLREENGNISAEREITLDFAPWEPVWEADKDGGGRYWYSEDLAVTDVYTLQNTSSQAQTVSVLYPFATDLYRLPANQPTLTLDGRELETTLHTGSFSGGFYGAWGSHREGLPEANLDQAKNWEAYRDVLADGSYQANALEAFPDFSGIPVVVYEFLEPWGPERDREDEIYPTIRAEFTLEEGKSTVFTTGFHGMTGQYDYESSGDYDIETKILRMAYSFSIPGPNERILESFRLVVLGEDLRDMDVNAYDTGGPDGGSVIENAGVTVRRTESDLETVLREIAGEDYVWRWENREDEAELDFELFFGLMKDELAFYYRIIDADPEVRYADSCIFNADLGFCNVNRVFYLEAEVVIPAGQSVTLKAEMLKEASFDYTCTNTKNRDVYGYDLTPWLGSNLFFTRQSASIEDRGLIKIVRDNFGFDLKKGVKTAELSPEEEHYYLEVQRIK